jgi:hypothetical protein
MRPHAIALRAVKREATVVWNVGRATAKVRGNPDLDRAQSARWRYAIRGDGASLRSAVTPRNQDAADRGTWTIVVIWHLLSGPGGAVGRVL